VKSEMNVVECCKEWTALQRAKGCANGVRNKEKTLKERGCKVRGMQVCARGTVQRQATLCAAYAEAIMPSGHVEPRTMRLQASGTDCTPTGYASTLVGRRIEDSHGQGSGAGRCGIGCNLTCNSGIPDA
jgi:hypothetical protein